MARDQAQALDGDTKSTEARLRKGDLVRHIQSSTQWRFARVHADRGDVVDLWLFETHAIEQGVPRSQVCSIEEFFGKRQRRLSRTRAQLTELFYGHEFQRLRGDRLKEMQSALRREGVTFEPAIWPTSETRIKFMQTAGANGNRRANPVLLSLLPQWLALTVLPPGSRDPLGLQAPAETIVNEILPGLTVFTFRAGYYGFLAWAIRFANAAKQLSGTGARRDLVNAFERAFVLCEFIHHDRDDSCRVLGQRSKTRLLGSVGEKGVRVPDSILRNQNGAGSFRLFSTSLLSLGFAEENDDLATEGLLPYQLTSLGEEMASSFARFIDDDFVSFAMGKRTQPPEVLAKWGRKLCFSSIAHKAHYRRLFLRGLIRGSLGFSGSKSGSDAAKREATIRHLFAARLLNQPGHSPAASHDNLTEEDAEALEDDQQGFGISNFDVVLHFYKADGGEDLCLLKAMSVFELLSLGLSALFRAAVESVENAGSADINGLTNAIASASEEPAIWSVPMSSAKPRTVNRLVEKLFVEPDQQKTVVAASLGAELLLRVIRDRRPTYVEKALIKLAGEPVELLNTVLQQNMSKSLTEVLPALFEAMVNRHGMVSQRKNRQAWLAAKDGVLRKDDPQRMGVGFHSLRFPQLASLARDIGLREEDLESV